MVNRLPLIRLATCKFNDPILPVYKPVCQLSKDALHSKNGTAVFLNNFVKELENKELLLKT